MSRNLTLEIKERYVKLMREYFDVFSWIYDDLKVYDTDIIQDNIPVKEGQKPFRKKLRILNPLLLPLKEKDIKKLFDAKTIFYLRHIEWLANLVPIRKKNGEMRLCYDFRNLNKESLKDNYPLPRIDHILQKVVGSQGISMLDGFSGYNQIQIKPEDKHKTTFIFPWGTFAYRKMPFDLKNTGATF